jgi:hypothetical protein
VLDQVGSGRGSRRRRSVRGGLTTRSRRLSTAARGRRILLSHAKSASGSRSCRRRRTPRSSRLANASRSTRRCSLSRSAYRSPCSCNSFVECVKQNVTVFRVGSPARPDDPTQACEDPSVPYSHATGT